MEEIELEVEIENSPIPISIKKAEKILFQMKNCVCKIYTNEGKKVQAFFVRYLFQMNLIYYVYYKLIIISKMKII